jgi:hypothetical protein
VVPYLKAHHKLSHTTFQQDGAPPHVAKVVKDYLTQQFSQERVISRAFPRIWPPRSPDLNPCDYWFWGFLKSKVFHGTTFHCLDDLEARIKEEIANITQDQLRAAVLHFIDRLHAVIESEGGHFEQFM